MRSPSHHWAFLRIFVVKVVSCFILVCQYILLNLSNLKDKFSFTFEREAPKILK